MTRLSAHDLAFAYAGGPPVLDGVSLTLGSGEVACVLGPNGAGKSTLLRVLAGLLAPGAGRVEYDGSALAGWSARERAQHVAVVPQWLVRVPDLSVSDFVLGGRYGHLDAWRRAHATDHAAVRRALAAANVADLAERALPTLSGGQRRRAMVARALAQEAAVLLVDEPTSELDPEHQLSIFALLRRLASDGRGVLVVTHDLNLASQYGDRLLLLDQGRCVATGGPAEVLRPELLARVYRAPFHTGAWPVPAGGERPYAVPWDA